MICCGANEIPECATSALVGHHACREDAHQSILVTRRACELFERRESASVSPRCVQRRLARGPHGSAPRRRRQRPSPLSSRAGSPFSHRLERGTLTDDRSWPKLSDHFTVDDDLEHTVEHEVHDVRALTRLALFDERSPGDMHMPDPDWLDQREGVGRMLIQRITNTASRTRTGYISFPRD